MTPFELFSQLEVKICTHASCLSGLAKLTKQHDDCEISDVFNTLAISVSDLLNQVEFMREQMNIPYFENDDEATLAGNVPHHLDALEVVVEDASLED